MPSRPNLPTPDHPLLRHCPVCGLAMQATRSGGERAPFDRFECLSCRTVIQAPPAPRPAGARS